MIVSRDLYCSETQDIYDCETKENVDSNNLNLKHSSKHKDILSFKTKHDKVNDACDTNGDVEYPEGLDCAGKAVKESPIWCMDFCNDLIILGCADGRLEMWEASSGKFVVSWTAVSFLPSQLSW